MSTLISLLAGLLGTIVGALLAWFSARRQDRIRVGFDLHREFHSSAMIESRYKGGDLLRQHQGKTLQDMRDEIGASALQDVWNVAFFYQRLWLAIRYRGVQRRYIADMFGEIFDWWFLQFFQYVLNSNSELAYDINQFHAWLLTHAPESQINRWRLGHVFYPIDARGMLPQVD